MSTPNLEDIVRPFERPNVLPLRNRWGPAGGPGNVAFSLGGAGGRTTTWTFDGAGSVIPSDTNKFKESDRASTKVRVENEDDPSQFVEFCRADKITLSPQRAKTPPPRTSTYDTSGGYHDIDDSANSIQAKTQQYSFQYPTDKACVQNPSKPDKGC